MRMESEIEPPITDGGDDDEDFPIAYLHVSLTEPDGTGKTTGGSIPEADLTDEKLADALIDCVRGLATMRSQGLEREIIKRTRRR